ncbi:MAG: hypothetical protein ACRCZF_11805, partial [Gemmataceae bacterium]
FAVMFEWNGLSISQLGMARIQRVRLTEPVYGFLGQCQRMPNDAAPLASSGGAGTGYLPGGGYQLWIPNLTSKSFIGSGMNIVGMGATAEVPTRTV